MTFQPVTIALWGSTSTYPPLEWVWVDEQLTKAGTYWFVANSLTGPPHPRPVWGIWLGERLLLTPGSPLLNRELRADGRVTVHLDSGTDVVLVEGIAEPTTGAGPAEFLGSYTSKYGQSYDIAELGPPVAVRPTAVLAYRTAGWAGKDGFREAGKWVPVVD